MKKYRSASKEWLLSQATWTRDECLFWPFARNSAGYGVFKAAGEYILAHRFMCTLENGVPPHETSLALHTCANGHKGCVNPKHLRWGDRSINYEDSVGEGTAAFGERHGHAKLSLSDVLAIRSTSSSAQDASEAFGVTAGQIRRIRAGAAWKRAKETV